VVRAAIHGVGAGIAPIGRSIGPPALNIPFWNKKEAPGFGASLF
jgi:hypothetical protein